MQRLVLILAALLGFTTLAAAQTRPLPPPEIGADNSIRFGNALKLGKREAGKTIITPDSLQILGGGSTGDISTMSVKPTEGTVARPLSALFSNQLYAVNFGVAAGAADNGPALRTAMSRAQDLGARLVLPPFDMNVCAGSDPDALLRIERFMDLVGSSQKSRIVPCSNAGSRAILLVKPLALGGGIRGAVLRDFSIGTLGPLRAGGDGILIDTTNRHGFVAKLTVDNVSVADAGAGKWSVRHVNVSTVDAQGNQLTGNLTGGLFGSTFQNSDFFGGVKFSLTGDSNNVLRNVLTGPNAGLDYEAITGAAMHVVEGNNVTASGGGIICRNTAQFKALRNQAESVHGYTGSDGALYTADNCIDGEYRENNGNSYDQTDVFLLKNGSTGNVVEGNSTIYSTQAGKVLARLVGAPGNTIGRQHSDTAFSRDGQGNRCSRPGTGRFCRSTPPPTRRSAHSSHSRCTRTGNRPRILRSFRGCSRALSRMETSCFEARLAPRLPSRPAPRWQHFRWPTAR